MSIFCRRVAASSSKTSCQAQITYLDSRWSFRCNLTGAEAVHVRLSQTVTNMQLVVILRRRVWRR